MSFIPKAREKVSGSVVRVDIYSDNNASLSLGIKVKSGVRIGAEWNSWNNWHTFVCISVS
jgi:hypothetical protein